MPAGRRDNAFENLLTDFFHTDTISVVNDLYVEAIIQKSPVTRTYSRNFNKIDNFLSYVGGMIGTILGFAFVLSFFSERAYEISIASQLFTLE